MISFRVELTTIQKNKADTLAYFIAEDKSVFKAQTRFLKESFPSLTNAFSAGTFLGKHQESITLFPSERKIRLVLVGLGEQESLTMEKLRRASAVAAKSARTLKSISLGMFVPQKEILSQVELDIEAIGTALTEGAGLALYKFDKYLTGSNKKPSTLKHISILTENPKHEKELRRGVAFGEVIIESVWLARDLANAPPDEIYPDSLSQRALEIRRNTKLAITVFDEKKIKKLNMGGVIAVSKGSEKPPRFIILEHNRGKRSLPTIVLVGKGVTFDSGGISIKPAAGMGEMKMDMAGSAAVIATMQAVAKLRLPLHVVGLIPAVENLLNGRAMKPGDILRHLNGKTSEVDNTDAEGRLILADALSYAERYNPDVVIDLATLTGAVVVSLGNYATGMMGNDQSMMDALKEAGEQTYERVWQLPMFEEYEKLNKSDVADVKNSGGRLAGAISAAFFLKQFIGDYKWVHLDIAGTAILNESLEYIPKGGSGVGVRLLVNFLRNYDKQ